MTYNTMAKDIKQTKVLKHNKEHDIQYNDSCVCHIFGHCIGCPALCCVIGLLFVLYLWPLYCMSCSLLCFRTTKSRTSNTMAKDLRQTKVLKHNKEQDIQYNGQRYKTNKSLKTQQRAGQTIQWPIVLSVLLFVVF
jgi:hypothetical protein